MFAVATLYVLQLRAPEESQAAVQPTRPQANDLEFLNPGQAAESVAMPVYDPTAGTAGNHENPVIVDEVELQARHDELTALIEEYNLYLHDPEKRRQIEAQAAVAAESYKREVLARVKSRQ